MTNIQKLVFYSKTILMLKLLKIKFNNFLTEIKEIRIHIPSSDMYIKAMLNDVNIQITILNNEIRLVLQTFFGKRNFEGYDNVNSWGLTKEDLERGYLRLLSNKDLYVLLLIDVDQYKAGTLVKLTKSERFNIRRLIEVSTKTNLFGDLPDINKSLIHKPIKIQKG